MQRAVLTAFLLLALASGARTAYAEGDPGESTAGPKSTLSLHPIGTLLFNGMPDFHFLQFTYEYHPGPGRLSWAWDPGFIFGKVDEEGNPLSFGFWMLPIIAPRWYFNPDAHGWFGGLKLGYIHASYLNVEEPPAYATRKKYRDRNELGYAAGEAGFKRDWRRVSLYASGQLGLTLGALFREYTEEGRPMERSSHMTATPFGQINCGLGYRF